MSLAGLDPKRYSLPGKEHDRIYRNVVRPRVWNIPAAEHPAAVILCGTPGMGKSSVARQILANEPAAKISSDKLSKFHPRWSHLLAADESTAVSRGEGPDVVVITHRPGGNPVRLAGASNSCGGRTCSR
ncbi:zeta toxin family protein [Streptomyces europaeiscabiei]|uniref:zeta toxin family protein n=1 Tax=Streptomyces europaeiscabiei TaxID=146819 RepID=UPI003869B16E